MFPPQFRAGCVPAIRSGSDVFAQSQDGSYDPSKGPLFNVVSVPVFEQLNFYFGSGFIN